MSVESASVQADTPPPAKADTFLIAIGSSAGGLEAIRELVKKLTTDIPASYVVVQHMAPKHKSLMTSLIRSETALEVVDLEDGAEPRLHTIHVTPPNHDVVLSEGRLRLLPPSEEAGAPKPSIDRFFLSVASELGDKGVAMVLSGTGSDGAYGVQAVGGAGGITIAQDDATAKYDGMPLSAIETGCVDLVLNPTDISTHLARILQTAGRLPELESGGTFGPPFADLLQILLARTRVDFREYKPTTVLRRIERRMTALGITDQTDYTSFCRTNPNEVDALFKDLLISVTRFFRDPSEFQALHREMLDRFKEPGSKTLRVWVAGCATGEEVYSIAICLAEALGGPDTLDNHDVQIFATDIDEPALKIARDGRYPLAALDDVPTDFVEKYFQFTGDGVRVNAAVREMVLFARHNMCQDPPFLNLDLVSCRNVLIYFGAGLRRKVLTRCHYGMKPGALLFLGSAESNGGAEDLYQPVGNEGKLYSRRLLSDVDHIRSRASALNVASEQRLAGANTTGNQAETVSATGIDRTMFEGLAKSLGPNSMLVSQDLRILRVFGDLGPFVTLRENARLALSVGMLRDPLGQEARTLITLAIKNGDARRGRVHHEFFGPDRAAQLTAYPVAANRADDSLALIVFGEVEAQQTPRPVDLKGSSDISDMTVYIEKLESEIDATREALQQTVEQLETSNEELQSLNEELQSANEELQATNEELETSNEELQSTNEELVTVNEELQVNSADLATLTEELEAVLENIGTPVIIVDTALQIRRSSAEANTLFRIDEKFEGLHLSQISLPNEWPDLTDVGTEVMQRGRSVSLDFVSDQIEYALRCAPFLDQRGRLKGASFVTVEVTR